MSDETQQEGARLIAAMATGNRRALGRLIALHGRGLTLVATRYLSREDEAEEIVQDTFLRAWRHAGRYDPAKAKVLTWLYRITVNLCIDRQRRNALRRFIGFEDVARNGTFEVEDLQPTAETRFGDQAQLAQVRTAIAGLPDRQRMALLLSAVGELDNPEIAEAMRISRGAVEQLLVRARRTLRMTTGQDEDIRQ